MCGICGYISKMNIPDSILFRMNKSMEHRGPDDEHLETVELRNDYKIGFAHKRLSIIELSDKGRQPMYSNSGNTLVVFNGEIYNYKEIRATVHNYDFKSNSDTEVILAAYEKWGIKFVHRLNGMYSIGLFDRAKNKLYLIRDRVGKKPLYYWKNRSEIFFSSEMKPFFEIPWFEKKINTYIINRYLFQRYINSPDSIFCDVRKVRPATILEIDINNGLNITENLYWNIREEYKNGVKNIETDFAVAKGQLDKLITEAVRKRMVADVPIGCLLSGGIDSTLVASIAQKITNQAIHTYTIGFEEKKYDEAIYAKEIANYIGSIHSELYINEAEMLKLVAEIPQYYDEPFADASQIPTMLVSKLVKKQATVCLSGDGGDEFFCGYDLYTQVAKAQRWDKIGALADLIGNIRLMGLGHIKSLYPSSVRKVAGNRDIETKCQLNPDILMSNANTMINKELEMGNCQYQWEREYGVKDWTIRHMLLDMETSLPEDMLCKVDRGSMSHSVEMRNPLLDLNVMKYSFCIPHKFKLYHGSDKKYILKQLTYDYVPKILLDRPKKGFNVPIEKWLKTSLKEQLLDYAEMSFLRKQGIFDPAFTNGFVCNYVKNTIPQSFEDKNNFRLIWSFFVFQQWYEKYIN